MPLFVLEVVVRSLQPPDQLVSWLQHWNYLEEASAGERREQTFLLVLARLLEGEPGAGLVPALTRLADILVPCMEREMEPLARRKHELLSNNLLRLMVNLGSHGEEIWQRYQGVTTCRHSLSPEVNYPLFLLPTPFYLPR